jgi:hypothetical protein
VAHVSLDNAAIVGEEAATDVVTLDDFMDALARLDPCKVRVVEMRFFGGLSVGRDRCGAERVARHRNARLEQRQGQVCQDSSLIASG